MHTRRVQNTHYYLAACAIIFSACSVDFMKLSFAKPLAKNGIPGISILHDTSILVLFPDNGLNVSNLVPITGPCVIFVATDCFGCNITISCPLALNGPNVVSAWIVFPVLLMILTVWI